MKFVKQDSVRPCFLGFIFALLMSVAGMAQAGLREPLLQDDDAPQVKALLKKAWAVESGKVGHAADQDSAYSLYLKAGTFGSAEGYYRAALVRLPANDQNAQQNALCLLSIASGLGHAQATTLLDHRNQKAYCR